MIKGKGKMMTYFVHRGAVRVESGIDMCVGGGVGGVYVYYVFFVERERHRQRQRERQREREREREREGQSSVSRVGPG
jgi:hypothetical protein